MAEKVASTKNEDMEWAEERIYVDKQGRRIVEFTPLFGSKKGEKLYKGKVMLLVRRHPDPRVPPQQMPFEFDFPEKSVFSWVRKNFDKVAQKAIDEFEEEQKKAQAEKGKEIIPATSMPKIIGADGKPA
jgi:hypothetical protein